MEYETDAAAKSALPCAEDSGKLVATQGMLPIPVQVGSESVLSGRSESTLLLTADRGSPRMGDLHEYAVQTCMERGIPFIWSFASALKAFHRFGFVHFTVAQTMVRPGDIGIDAVSGHRRNAPLWRRIVLPAKLAVRSTYVKRARRTRRLAKDLHYQVTQAGTCDEGELRDLHDRLRRTCSRQTIYMTYDRQYL